MRLTTTILAGAGLLLAAPAAVLAADAESLPGGAGAPAARQCLEDLRAFEAELAEVGFGVLPPGGASPPFGYYVSGEPGTPRERMGALRDAAYVYAASGDEQACQGVLASMRKVYEEHEKLTGRELDDPRARRVWRRVHLSRSRPVAEMGHLMRSDVLVGSELRNLQDERLGEIEDLVLNPETRAIAYVLVSSGGFLGLGGKLVAVRWDDLRATGDHELYVLDASADALENAPAVERRNFEGTAADAWLGALNRYWDGVLAK